jgi:hypothetical protein
MGLAAGAMSHALPWWAVVIASAVGGPVVWLLSGCSHPGPLGLLPATTDLGGQPLPPRWFCDQCGKTWAANFEKEHKPIPRFTGYDESKAVESARRAAQLADRQRGLALQRAGFRAAVKPSRVLPDLETADVVLIGKGRRMIG